MVAGRGAPLVLVPGGLTGWRSWEPHVEQLARERQVIRTQLLSVAYGLSDTPLPSGYGVSTESRALVNALDELALGAVDIVGWSYGGEIALDIALDHPERIRSLILIEPAASWVLPDGGRPGSDASRITHHERRYVDSAGEVSEANLERFLFEAGIVPDDTDPRTLPQWPVWLEHRNSLRIGDAPERHRDSVERLRSFDRPVLLFSGEGSTRQDREIVAVLGRELPDARIEKLPGGHALHLVSLQPFLAILNAFLAGHALP